MRCEHYQTLLLDHLYGLLDAAEVAAVESHLIGCADCTAARTAAEHTQGLFARAAKVSFPNVRFVPPEAAPTTQLDAPPERAVAPLHRGRSRPPVSWARWAVAASLLALVPAAVVTVSGWASRFDAAKRTADRVATEHAAARDAADRIERALAAERAARREALAAARKTHDDTLTAWVAAERAATEGRPSVEVSRPVSVQPGAPNEFRVNVRNAGRGPVEAAVRDQDGKVLFRQPLDGRPAGGHAVRLPAEVWTRVGPQTELFLAVTATDAAGNRTDLDSQVRLFGPVYTTLLVTDRPAYRPGERLFFRSLTLDRVSFRPPAREQHLKYELLRPDGKPVPGLAVTGSTDVARVADGVVEPVAGPDGKPVRGVGCGAFVLPPGLPDGDYFLTLTEPPHPANLPPTVPAPVRRVVQVRGGAAEKFQKRIEFAAASYSPGDVVEAWVELKQQDKPVAGVPVKPQALADRFILPAQAVPARTLKDGRAKVVFQIPPQTRGGVRLKVTFETPGGEETVTRPVPVVGRSLAVEFFPEGGDLIAGVPARVYVRATTPTGQPVDLRGTVTDGKNTLARVETLNDPKEPGVNRGLGVFTFTPQLGTPYWLTLDRPANATAPLLDGPVPLAPAGVVGVAGAVAARTGFALPKVQSDGVAMTTPDAVTAPGQPVRVTLHSAGRPRTLVVGAYTRGRLADTKRVAADAGKPVEVTLMAGADPRGGVTRVTVFEDPNPDPAAPTRDLVPVAERLVFRKPGEVLNLAYTATPGDDRAVELRIAATDETGQPAAAVLWAAVANAANVAGPRDRLMPTHFLLAGETQTPDALEHADFLLTDHPRAAEVLDLVLATQGWRRFVEQRQPDPKELAAAPDVARLVATTGQRPLGFESSAAREHRRLHDVFWPQYQAAVRGLDAAKRAAAAPQDTRPADDARRVADERAAELVAARSAVAASEEPLLAFRAWAWYAVGGLVAAAVVLGVVTCARPNGPGGVLPLGIAAAAALGLAAYLGTETPAAKPPVAAKGEVANESRATASEDGPDVKSEPVDKESPAPPSEIEKAPAMMRLGPDTPTPKIDPRNAGQGLHGENVAAPGLTDLPDARHDPFGTREARAAVGTAMASDAADDPARRAAEKAANDRAADLTGRMAQALDAVPRLDAAAVARVRAAVPRVPPLVVREYAAPRPGSQTDAAESDTVFWHPLIVLPTDGKTTVSFHTGTEAGGYQVMIAGHTPDGRIGAVRGLLPVGKTAPRPTK